MINNNKNQVIAVGGATRDIMFYSSEGELLKTGNLTKQRLLAFEYGAKIYADKLYFTFGGGAANAAATFANLGLKTAVACRIGQDDDGAKILQNFKNRKIDTGLVVIDKNKTTGSSMILTVDNVAREHIVFLHRGANNDLNYNDLPLSRLSTDWFYITSLPAGTWVNIMTVLTKQNKNIAWNPGGRQLADLLKLKKFLPKVKVLIVNHDEGLEFRKLKDMKGLLRHIYSFGPKIVVITDGNRGAYAFDGQKYYFQKAVKVKSVDTVGVGDAFGSAFTAALIYGKTIRQAMAWGINNSASTITKIGAQNGLLNLRQIKS